MNKSSSFSNIYKIILGVISSLVSVPLYEYFDKNFKDKGTSFILLLICVSIIVLLLSYVIEFVIEKSVLVRKIVLGNEFFERYYYDITREKDKLDIVHGVLIKIEYAHSGYIITGTTFDEVGDRVATFHSTKTVYEDRILFFEYESYRDFGDISIEQGITQLQFDNPATSYSGFYISYDGTMNYRVTGVKVDKENMLRYSNFKNNHQKSDFMISKIKEISKS